MNWKRTLGQKLRHLSPAECKRIIAAIQANGVTIEQPEVRKLTGGYASQSINFYVIRKLADKANSGIAG